MLPRRRVRRSAGAYLTYARVKWLLALCQRRCIVSAGSPRQLAADYGYDAAGDTHGFCRLRRGVDVSGNSARQTVRIAGGNVVLIERGQLLAESSHHLQRHGKFDQGVA